MNACVINHNKYVAGYLRVSRKPEQVQKRKENYNANRESIYAKRQEKIHCECGAVVRVTTHHIQHHLRKKKLQTKNNNFIFKS